MTIIYRDVEELFKDVPNADASLIERYAVIYNRWKQCKEAIDKFGLLAKSHIGWYSKITLCGNETAISL